MLRTPVTDDRAVADLATAAKTADDEAVDALTDARPPTT
jgi:hypothetical protein